MKISYLTNSRLPTEKAQNLGVQNILVKGYVSQTEIPDYLGAADFLLLPNSGKSVISAKYTSPLKLFEYLASGRPIIASALPSLQEILTKETATFFTPDSSDALKKAITEIFDDKAAADYKAKIAKQKSLEFTWEKRVQKIVKFI